MPENRTPEELAALAKEIRRRVSEKVREAVRTSGGDSRVRIDVTLLPDEKTMREDRGADPGDGAVFTEASAPSSDERTVPTASGKTGAVEKDVRDDRFWDLGKPKPRVYEKPAFRSHSISVTDIDAPDPEPVPGENAALSERIVKDAAPRRDLNGFDLSGSGAKAESIPPRESGNTGRVVRTADGYRSVQTGSYRRHTPPRSAIGRAQDPAAKERRQSPGSQIVRTYSPGGVLIRSITVRTWESDTEFYNRFLSDAARSHATPYEGPAVRNEPVPYTSFVPQYAHMSMGQLDFYRYVRERVRHGETPPCDFPYILLYIYEIINLPELIPPEEGAQLLATLWLGYRNAYPRLDGTLCEWLPDYCMIHGVALPDRLGPILPEIVPKAQLKEFYLDRASSDAVAFARVVIENSSDYDFRNSRYYPENRNAYEKHIPAAVARALEAEKEAGAGIFALDRIYRMTRDSYVGAVAASSIKRRIDLEFVSFTRRAETRGTVTATVKYAENRLRATLGIKAKLGTDGVGAESAAKIDAYFVPMLPTKEQIRQKKEDAYMPPDYLKNYEAEDSGFDPAAAAAIEAESWVNTSRLTGEDYGSDPAVASGAEEEDLVPYPGEEADGAVFSEALSSPEPDPESEPERSESGIDDSPGREEGSAGDALLTEALRAAMNGRFRGFCRENGLYEGDAADRINGIFLEKIGDIVLEPDGVGFRFVDEYREDAEEWLRTETKR